MSAALDPVDKAEVEYWASVNGTSDATAESIVATEGRRQLPPSPTSWSRVDLTVALTADYKPVRPTIGKRSDGHGMCYAGRTHSVIGESEALKSWFAQYMSVQELGAGHAVTYIDFEDDAAAVARRMLMLGALPQWITERFAYISPTEPLGQTGQARQELTAALGDLKPSLAIIDGVTEGMSLHALSSIDNDDVAKFGRLLTRPITDTGAASVSLDHQPKSAENRGRYALGAVHKLNAISGAAYILENIARFGEGMVGRSRLLIAKDRPGQLRANALPGTADRFWYGDLVLDTARQPEPATIEAPHERTEPFQPTVLMAKVAAALTGAPGPLTQTGVTDRVRGRAIEVRRALAALIDAGYVTAAPGGQRGAVLHTLTRPYTSEDDTE